MGFEDRLYSLLSLYIRSPQWVKSIFGRLYLALPPYVRRGRHYPRFLEQVAVHDPAALAQLSRAKLTETLRWALQTVPRYASYAHLLGQLEADPYAVLQQLPIVSKSDVKADLDDLLSRQMPLTARLKTFTGGSTAQPMMFYLHKGVTRTKEYAFMDSFHRRVGLSDKDVVLALRGRSVPGAGRPGASLWMYEPIKRQLILSCDHLERANMPAYVEAIRRWKPRFIQAYPSALHPLARWLKEHPAPDVTAPIRGIMLYSENVYEGQMAMLRSVFDCPILCHYGHSERVLMAASMPDDERCFFWPQYGHVELLDVMGRPVTQPGELGELVGTCYDNQVMPFVRYRTGDLAVLSDRPHPALPGYFAVERIEGRLQEFLVCHDHRLISICTMGAAHFDDLAAVEMIQYEQFRPGHFLLNVVASQALSDAARGRIARAVYAKTQGGCQVEVREVAQIARTASGKHRMLLQHLDISEYFGATLAS
ncbi:hypothetical protein GTP23_20270 [Pseudoduganella sp. FT93W]|uniref:Phenylacetate--CoA ligase family protein n=1 Tax=Duganella fentianensis TaxID=2692177 RepID=A0A845I250_9BURK|nr:phenylacetate--CoA ligase family protein [Duganella fentianensis]MYN47383.1 hypothetical protein [Duganella fentianensis]